MQIAPSTRLTGSTHVPCLGALLQLVRPAPGRPPSASRPTQEQPRWPPPPPRPRRRTLQPGSLCAKKMFDRPPERPCMQLLSARCGSARRRPPRCNDGPATPRVVRWG
eukprot:COSAG01_NODE_88_length_27337_cov_22.941699_38_plen_108_part_00